MSPVATDGVVLICVCLLLMAVIVAKAAELMEMPFRGVRLMWVHGIMC